MGPIPLWITRFDPFDIKIKVLTCCMESTCVISFVSLVLDLSFADVAFSRNALWFLSGTWGPATCG